MRSISRLTIPTLIVAMLAACANPAHRDITLESTDDDGNLYGRVEAIQATKIQGSDDIGMGAVVGGLIGGLVASQFGGGNGKIFATTAGIGGGALIGNEFEQKSRPHEIYKIRVQLDSGDYKTVSQDNDTDLDIGSRVHINNGRVYRY